LTFNDDLDFPSALSYRNDPWAIHAKIKVSWLKNKRMDRRTRPILLPFSLTRSAKKELDEAQSQSELAQSLACSPILSRIDYCNAVFHGASSYSIKKLQGVQNNAARITTTSWRYTDLFIIIIMVGVPEVGDKN